MSTTIDAKTTKLLATITNAFAAQGITSDAMPNKGHKCARKFACSPEMAIEILRASNLHACVSHGVIDGICKYTKV